MLPVVYFGEKIARFIGFIRKLSACFFAICLHLLIYLMQIL